MDALLGEARALAMGGQTYAALARYRRIVQRYPDNSDGWLELGVLLERLMEVDGALEAYETCAQRLESQGRQGEAAQVRARSARLDATARNDVRTLQGRVGRSPQDPLAHTRLAEAYLARGMVKEALGEFQEVVRLAPRDAAFAYEKLGEIFERLRKPAASIAVWYRNAGEAYCQRGELADAVRAYEAALRHVPTDKAVRAALEELYTELSRSES